MLNQTMLVGRIIKISKEENVITIGVPRSIKNVDGVYETDYFDIKVFGCIIEKASDYCKKGDIIGVKARLQVLNKEDEEDKIEIIGEKITFLSSIKEV